MRAIWRLILSLIFFAVAAAANAQETPKWSDMDCSQSKIEGGPAGLKCRATQEYSGGSSSAGKVGGNPGVIGTFRHWSKFRTIDGVKYFYFLKEATTTGSNILPMALQQALKDYAPAAKGARDFTEVAPISGGEYLRFADLEGEKCIATRKMGTTAGPGNRWYLMGTKCVPSGRTISDADVISFLASVNAPRAGF